MNICQNRGDDTFNASVSTVGQPFIWSVRVYWEDTDAGGVVYHASYLRFLERARTEWLRGMGVCQRTLQTTSGIAFLVRAMHLDFLRSARLDDALQVTVTLEAQRPASLLVTQTIYQDDSAPLLRASTRLACMDVGRIRPTRIPASILKRLSGADACDATGV